MPTITPQGRTTIGGSSETSVAHRSIINASTGMGIPSLRETKPEGNPTTTPVPTGQQDTTEDTTAPAVTLSPQLTALARKQQKLQAEIQAQRDKEASWEKEKADYVPKNAFKAKLQQNAAEALKDLGLDYEELTQLMLNQQNGEDPVKALASEFQGMKKAQEEAVNKQYEATLKQYKTETVSLVSKDPKKYFLIDKEGAHDAVVQHIVETWEENPDVALSVEDAANDIEEYLRDEAKKKKAYLEELEGHPVQATETKKLPPPRTGARTLTQQIESAPTRTYNQFQHMSMKDRIAASIARAQK